MTARPLFDARILLGDEPAKGFDRSLYPDEIPLGTKIYKGKKVRWVGKPGTMIKLYPDQILPQRYNWWFPNQLAWAKAAAKEGAILFPPEARARLVDDEVIEYSEDLVEEGELHRPFTEEDLGQVCAELADGNHRGFGALLAGEPYLWAYVPAKYRRGAIRKFLR